MASAEDEALARQNWHQRDRGAYAACKSLGILKKFRPPPKRHRYGYAATRKYERRRRAQNDAVIAAARQEAADAPLETVAAPHTLRSQAGHPT